MWALLVGIGLFVASAPVVRPQDTPDPPAADRPQPSQYFSGTITEFDAAKLSVVRALVGKPPVTRVFQMTPETKIDGKLKTKARVTVRFTPSSDGDQAVYVLVRAATPPKK